MEPTEQNIRAWDEAHRRRPEPVALPPLVERTLGDLSEKRVLHLQCATGEATAALAELGAVATGVDPREELLDAARERWPKILWVQGAAQSLPAALRSHGELLVFDDHPIADCVDGLLRWREDYFRDPADPQRLWRVGQVVSALARAGMHLAALEEYPGGTSRLRHDRRVPATFLLYARREA